MEKWRIHVFSQEICATQVWNLNPFLAFQFSGIFRTLIALIGYRNILLCNIHFRASIFPPDTFYPIFFLIFHFSISNYVIKNYVPTCYIHRLDSLLFSMLINVLFAYLFPSQFRKKATSLLVYDCSNYKTVFSRNMKLSKQTNMTLVICTCRFIKCTLQRVEIRVSFCLILFMNTMISHLKLSLGKIYVNVVECLTACYSVTLDKTFVRVRNVTKDRLKNITTAFVQ